MEHVKYHELLKPIRDITSAVIEKIGDWVIGDALTDLFNGVTQESASRTQEMFTQGEMFKD